MKRLLIALAISGMVAACSTTTKDEQSSVKVEERKPTVTQPTQPMQPQTSTAAPESTGANPLRDPNNILSKRSVFFDYDQYTVKDEFRPMVGAHAKYVSSNTAARMTIQGNTDDRGSREYNLALGQKRADAVKQAMVLSGAPSQNIETVSFGEEKPRAQGHDEASWAENRRADIVYQGE
jgi:peptidoglycan-associated lipoprotein